MIRISAVFPLHSPLKEVAVQTDQTFPKIKARGEIYPLRSTHSPIATPLTKTSPKASNKSKAANDGGGKINAVHPVATPKVANKAGRNHKENAYLSASSSKLQTKAFKFLRFEDDLLKSAMLKHLDGRELSKQERNKMKQIVDFSFISVDNSRPRYDDDFSVIEIPEEEHLSITVRHLVDAVREVYGELGVESRERECAIHKRIIQVVQTLVAQGGRAIYEPTLSSCHKQQILTNYLRRYVGESEHKSHCFNPNDAKLQLMGFYQDIYNRYQAVPFTEDSGEPVLVLPDEPTPLQFLKSPTSTISRGKSSAGSEESFIKLRFYNNLRREVQSLSEDTEKIMAEESSKLTHS